MAWILAVASGLGAGLACPPFDVWPAAWLAPALLLLAVRGASLRVGFGCGLAAGAVFHLFAWWLLPAGLSVPQYLAVGVVYASYMGVFGAGAVWLEQRRPVLAPLAIPSLWCVLEWLRANLGWLAVPWGVLGYTQWRVAPLAGVGAVAGVWGVSFVLVGAAALSVEWLGPRRPGAGRRASLVALALAAAGLLAAGALPAAKASPSGRTIRVAVLQAGRHVPGRDDPRHAIEVFERYRALTRAAAAEGPALIVWPEGSMPASLPSDGAAKTALAALAREVKTHLLIGSSGRDKSRPQAADRWANSAFLFSPAGRIVARYDKIRLLPFDEFVPLRYRVPWPSWVAYDGADAEAGLERTVFAVDGARFGALICWENLFGREFRRSAAQDVDFMVSLTNEAFAEQGPGRQQMFVMNAFRAIENGMPVARSATTGVSGFVAPDGRVLARVTDASGRDLDVNGLAVQGLELGHPPTFYRRHGDWIVALATVILLASAVFGRKGARAS